jgi:hypothetical protein
LIAKAGAAVIAVSVRGMMSGDKHMSEERHRNQEAFRQMRDGINQTYPKGRFVAISRGTVVADADDFQLLQAKLHDLGADSPDVLVVQAGIDYPDKVVIFFK